MNTRFVTIFLSLLTFSSAMASPLSPADRDEIERSTFDACIKRQTPAPENANIPAQVIKNFCSCVGELTAKGMSAEDAAYTKNSGDMRLMLNATMAAYDMCRLR
jgi:hypothetical protein